MRLLVTGVSGFLGAYVAQMAHAAGTLEVAGTYHSHPPQSPGLTPYSLDLRDASAVQRLLAAVRPDSVVHTACSNRDSDNINAIVLAAENLAAACHAHGARLVHVSTDMVFDGEQAPYADEAAPRPITSYGAAKAEAEAAIVSRYPAAAIGRPSLIWSLAPLDRQTGWLVNGLRRGTPVTLFTDEIRCPVYLPDLTAALLELAAQPALSGPFNLGGRQALSRWDFGLRLLAALKLAPGPNLQPGTVAASGLVRARNLTLEARRAAQSLSTVLRGVDEVRAASPSPAARSEQTSR